MTTQLAINQIRTDGGTQPRAQLDFTIVGEYAEAMADGAHFPPIVVFYDGADHWLADGFHRLQAAQQSGSTTIGADVRQGSLEDARWHSYGVNQTHGLRRTNEDKRRAVEAALAHPYHSRFSDREIAGHVGVSREYVVRVGLSCDRSQDRPDTRLVTRNGTTYEMQTANIGSAVPFMPTADDYADPYGDNEPVWGNSPPTPDAIRRQQIALITGSSESNEWYTPRAVIDLARAVLGEIDLDPASCAQANAIVGAQSYCTIAEDGYSQPWGHADEPVRVWLNPPYGKEDDESETNAIRWSRKLIAEYEAGRVAAALLLVKAALGYNWFEDLWVAYPTCLLRKRLAFVAPDGGERGQAKHATAILYLGPDVASFQRVFRAVGRVVLPEEGK